MAWLESISRDPVVLDVASRVERGGAIALRGVAGSSTILVVAALREAVGDCMLVVVAHLDEADEAVDELEALGVDVARLPAMEVMPGESGVNVELLGERLKLVRRLAAGDAPAVIVAPIAALMQVVPEAGRLDRMLRVIRVGDTVELDDLTTWLVEHGYRRVEAVEAAGDVAVRGGIVDVFPAGGGDPVRVDLFGDVVDGLFAVDLDTMGSDRRLEQVDLIAADAPAVPPPDAAASFVDGLPDGAVGVLAEPLELNEQARSYTDRAVDASGLLDAPSIFRAVNERCRAVLEAGQYWGGTDPERAVDLPVEALATFDEAAPEAMKELKELAAATRTVVLCQNDGEAARFRELLDELDAGAPAPPIEVETRYLHRGLRWRDLVLVPYHELLNRYQTRRRVHRVATGRAVEAFVDLQPGELVVHRDHGIARFVGLRALDVTGAKGSGRKGAADEEYLTLEFARGAKLNVPASRIEVVQKYIGAFAGTPELSKLGGRKWGNQKDKVSDAVRELAGEMLRLQAVRESMPGIRFPADTVWQHEFEAEFPYEETADQLTSIAAVKRDMSAARPMDRLICGDVGFGKTEVAIRAAFKAAEYGRQVAVLVPTTVLAEQHVRTFRQRFADYPFRVETISRFKTAKEANAVVQDLRLGKVDIVIGTHRLLSKDVKFADLGLVIIDEEQRFGVEHKQRLLGFRATADVLTMSATPIPRTLHMAMLGLRDISSLTTPPLDRRAIVTEVIGEEPKRIQRAIRRELAREGQVFFVYNRVYDIESVADEVRRLAPDARIIIGHGQMPARELESVMLKFVRGDADILVSTTIIESGIDIPTANTMIIKDAHMFGLSELHQLRGRVGRYKHRAYCYLMLPPDRTVTETAMKRLRALESFSMLGAGFRIAMRDLEIRGAGNILGAEQSGHISVVGYEMYCQLLEEAVRELKGEKQVTSLDTVVDLGITGSLPRGYIPSDARRMDAYRRVSQAADLDAIERLRRDLESAYGDVPKRGRVLLELAEIRVSAAHLDVRSIARHERDIIFRTPRPDAVESRMAGAKGTLRLVGDKDAQGLATVYYRPPESYLEADTLLTVLRRRLMPPGGKASGKSGGGTTGGTAGDVVAGPGLRETAGR